MKTIKFVSPLKVFLCDPHSADYDDDFCDGYPTISTAEAASYELQVLGQIKKEEMPAETLRGLMHYYDAHDEVNRKVLTARPTVEVIDGQLTGVCYCVLSASLTDAEQKDLMNYITGQYSDGWGEGFEQREIPIGDDRAILVSFWSSGNDWFIREQD